LRVSVAIRHAGKNLVIDAGPDFRQQTLRAKIEELDTILLTHEHNDHIIGLDDVRPFIFRQKRPMRVFCSERVAASLRERFSYAFAENPYPGAPSFDLNIIDDDTVFSWNGLDIQVVPYLHGRLPVQGFRFPNFAYLTDIRTIESAAVERVRHVDTLIISALHRMPHHSHASLDEALAIIERIAPRRAYLTHLSHWMGTHEEVSKLLPANVALAYDGLVLEVTEVHN
ncbi:MAG: MBL fold metallo-hydrolase, partial [Bacteroidota bacterium]